MAAVRGAGAGSSWPLASGSSSSSSSTSSAPPTRPSSPGPLPSLASTASTVARARPTTARVWADSDGTIQTDAPTATSPAELTAILTPMLNLALARDDDPTAKRTVTKLRLKSSIWPSGDVLDKLKAEYGVRLRGLDWDGNLDLLDAKVLPSAFHEASHACFAQVLYGQLELRGLGDFVDARAATEVELEALRRKQADSTMKPTHRAAGSPSLVIEAGSGESMAQVVEAARRWLWSQYTVGWVKIVIHVDAKTFNDEGQDRPWIRLTSWQCGDVPSSPLAEAGGAPIPDDHPEPVVRWANDLEYCGRPDEVMSDFPLPLCCLVAPDNTLPPGFDHQDNFVVPGAAMLKYAKKALRAWYEDRRLPVPAALLPAPL